VIVDTLIDPVIGIISTPVIDRERNDLRCGKPKQIDNIVDQQILQQATSSSSSPRATSGGWGPGWMHTHS
jgi:hypothetical protein